MATIKAVIIDPDGTVVVRDIENELGAFQAVVGGYIQPIFGNVATVYVNEEGLLRNLPFNRVATLFIVRVLGELGTRLFGRVLIVGTPSEGSDTDVRPAVVDYFTKEN